MMTSRGIYSVVMIVLLAVLLFPISGSAQTLTATLKYSSSVMDIGQSQVLSVNVTGGVPPYSYQWYVNGNALGISSSTYNFQPASTGTFTFYVNVTDSKGSIATTNSVTITVYSAMQVIVQPKNYVTDQNYYSYFNISISGGCAPYVYTWHVNLAALSINTTTFKSTSTTSSFTYIPKYSGNFTVWVVVNDTANATISSTKVYLLVNPTPKPYIAPGNSIAVSVKSTLTFYGYVNGGTPPYNFTWYVNGTKFGNNTKYFNYTFNSTGNYTVYFTERDSIGYTSTSAIAKILVTGASLPSVGYLNTPLRNVQMNSNMSIKASAYASGNYSLSWVLDDSIVYYGANYEFRSSVSGFHVFYAQAGVVLGGATYYVPGAFWSANITAVPYHIHLTAQKTQADAGKSVLLSVNSCLLAYPSTVYAVFRLGGQYYNSSVILNTNVTQVSISVPVVLGNGTLYIYGSVNPNLPIVLVYSNAILLSIVPQVNNVSISYSLVKQGLNSAVVNFSGSFKGGTGPFIYAWSVDGYYYNTQSFNYNVTFGHVYSIIFTVSDFYGSQNSTKLSVMFQPPYSVIQSISGGSMYKGIFYVNSSNLQVLINVSSCQKLSKVNYVVVSQNSTIIASGSTSKFIRMANVTVNGINYYQYLFMVNVSVPKEGNYAIYLITYQVSGISSNVSFEVVYNTAPPLIGKVLPAYSFATTNISLNLNNITSLVPIKEVIITGNFTNKSIVYFPPFSTVTIQFPNKTGYYCVNITVILANGITVTQNNRVYIDLTGIPFTASVVSYSGNEVTITLNLQGGAGATPVFYRVSTSPDFTGAQWQPFVKSFSVPVSADSGKIYIQIKDSNGVVTTYAVEYALPLPIYMQYLWVIIILPVIVVVLMIFLFLVKLRQKKVISSKFSSVNLSNVEMSLKENYFLNELRLEGSPRVKDFKRLMKARYGLSDSDFDEVLKSLVNKKKVYVSTDEEKKARIYPVTDVDESEKS